MTIADIMFIFFFLFISLILYYVAPDKIKELILLLISLFFYACGSASCFLFFCISLIVTVGIGRSIRHAVSASKTRKLLLSFGIIYLFSILFFCKYLNFLLLNISHVFHVKYSAVNIILPLGISFFVFKGISYLLDVYYDRAILSKSWIHDALYLSFFAQITSGPLSRYNDMQPIGITGVKFFHRLDGFSNGLYRFMIGFNKKILLANCLSHITQEIFSCPQNEYSTAYAWLGSISYSLQLFFDFSGYSDMAIGVTQMFGYNCPENFHFPYLTKSVSEFWRRWHITLGSWFRDYIYIPLGGSRVGNKRVLFNLLVVWALTGIWHGASWNFVFWGLAYFAAISFEKLSGYPNRLKRTPAKIGYRILTLLFINFQWVIFRSEGLKNGLKYIKAMLVYQANPIKDVRTVFLIKDYGFFLAAAIIFCFPVASWIEKKCDGNPISFHTFATLKTILTAILFIWALSFACAGMNNPFAYANF